MIVLMNFYGSKYGSDEVIEYLGIEEFVADQSETRIIFLGLIDNDYENEPFFNGRQ